MATLPELLREAVARQWEDYQSAAAEAGVPPVQEPELLAALCRVWAASPCVAQSCVRAPALLRDLVESGDLQLHYPPLQYAERLATTLADTASEADLGLALRRFRRREWLRIVWRDLAGWAPLEETLEDLSALADACIEAALAWLHARPDGARVTAGQRFPPMIVLALGKLGARELNLSSDVDLIYAYPELDGESVVGVGAEEYYNRLGQRLLRVLGEINREGFVFRVDLRLRPYGGSGPLVMGVDAMETYYQEQGREWERYALIKARAVSGALDAGADLLARLAPFVYRRYLDYDAFESLREMKALIRREVQRKGIDHNIKLGAGGIREIEFIAQAFQLIRGGRDPRLRERRLLRVLSILAEGRYLPEPVTRELAAAYRFLRRTEHCLQAVAEEQTHNLPRDELGCARLAYAMGYPDWEAFEEAVQGHREAVHGHFEQIATASRSTDAGPAEAASGMDAVWSASAEPGEAARALRAAGFDNAEEATQVLDGLRTGRTARSLGARGRRRLDQLMPVLLQVAASTGDPLLALLRVTQVIETIAGRSAYLALLVENPVALSQLVRLCAASPWVTTLLARQPALLDELIDPRTLYAPPSGAALRAELQQALEGLAEDDLEAQMERLRQFRQAQALRVAAADLVEALPLMRVSDYLTETAELVLREVLTLAWQSLVRRYGRPSRAADGLCDPGFAIIAYGKLGGIELGYGSDLDLVFLHDADPKGSTQGGGASLENAVFFARLGQRIIHILSTRTGAGILYEVDSRLRPSGGSGLLVSHIQAFADYQRQDAWTWEHQALVRARPVAGDAQVMARFQRVRAEVLARPRDRQNLAREVREMRARMRETLASQEPGRFDLKQGAGGIADIEFMVQYGVLLWSHRHASLLRYPDNIRILEGFANEGLLDRAEAQLLADAYRAYRLAVHRAALQEEPALVGDDRFRDYRSGVIRIWQRLLELSE